MKSNELRTVWLRFDTRKDAGNSILSFTSKFNLSHIYPTGTGKCFSGMKADKA